MEIVDFSLYKIFSSESCLARYEFTLFGLLDLFYDLFS
jgi:hypothetical protein